MNKIKSYMLEKLGVIGVILYYIIWFALYATLILFPYSYIVSGLPFIVDAIILLVLLTAITFIPPSLIIWWVWGLVRCINTPQDGFSTAYYILFVILFIPSVIYFSLSMIGTIIERARMKALYKQQSKITNRDLNTTKTDNKNTTDSVEDYYDGAYDESTKEKQNIKPPVKQYICSSCGAPLTALHIKCNKCGTPVSPEQTEYAQFTQCSIFDDDTYTGSNSNKSISGLFADAYDILSSDLRLIPEYYNEFEITAFLIVFFDYFAFKNHCDREVVRAEILDYIGNIDKERLKRREELYATIIRGEYKVRSEWSLHSIEQSLNPGINCAIAFGDILFNPDCADDYENTAIMLRDILETSEFANIFYESIGNVCVVMDKYFLE